MNLPKLIAKDDYTKILLKAVESDKKAVLLYVGFNFAVITLTLKAYLGSDKLPNLILLSLICLLLSGYLYFSYYRKLHLSMFGMIDTLIGIGKKDASELRKDIWDKYKARYGVAFGLQWIGILLYAAHFIWNTWFV